MFLKTDTCTARLKAPPKEGSYHPRPPPGQACLSNIFLHHVLDDWYANEVRPRLRGDSMLVRFADDLVMAFETFDDAERVLAVLGKRLARYGLTLHPDQTRFIDFRPQRPEGDQPPGTSGTAFDFLGFIHVWGGAEGSHGGSAGNGEEPLRQSGDDSHRLVQAPSASADARATCALVIHDAGALRLLRHHGERPAAELVCASGRAGLEGMAVATRRQGYVPMVSP